MKVPCCSVCQTRYDEEERVPLLLQCGHGFCKDCLSRMFSSCTDTTLVCPRCRHVSVVGNSVQALRKNFAVLALIHSSSNAVSSASAANFDCDYTDDEDGDEISNYPQGLVLIPRGTDDDSVVVGPHVRGSRLRASSAGYEEVDLLLPGTARLQIQLGVNMPARAEQVPGEKQIFPEVYDVVLYLGIIDILQDYSMGKKIEHAYKSLQFDSLSISAVDPTFYSHRFLEFIRKVFPPNALTR